ncbi:hypothetical protein C8Q72DRAFT_835981 [Fomitopsis betulina]|nr:hypothetical protein C8Q72DRAFT_835981 [Fomitopsis betulina]
MALTRSFTSARAASPARTGFARVRRRWPSQGSSLASVPNSAARHAYLPATRALHSPLLPRCCLLPSCPPSPAPSSSPLGLRTTGAGVDGDHHYHCPFSRPRVSRGIPHRRSAAAVHTACLRQHVLERSSSPPPVTTTRISTTSLSHMSCDTCVTPAQSEGSHAPRLFAVHDDEQLCLPPVMGCRGTARLWVGMYVTGPRPQCQVTVSTLLAIVPIGASHIPEPGSCQRSALREPLLGAPD